MENLFEDDLEDKCPQCSEHSISFDHCYIVQHLVIKFNIEKGLVVMRNICEYCDETFEFSALSNYTNCT